MTPLLAASLTVTIFCLTASLSSGASLLISFTALLTRVRLDALGPGRLSLGNRIEIETVQCLTIFPLLGGTAPSRFVEELGVGESLLALGQVAPFRRSWPRRKPWGQCRGSGAGTGVGPRPRGRPLSRSFPSMTLGGSPATVISSSSP